MLGDYDMKKGVSSVIAIILILMIVIALAALAYTWFSGIFASLTSTAGSAVTSTTTAMATQFRIEAARKDASNNVNILIRNIGTQSFNASKDIVGVYIDNSLRTDVSSTVGFIGCSGTGSIADKGCVVSYGIPAVAGLSCPTCPGACVNITKVTIGTGLTDTTNIVC
jgi:flagellin-like protein